MKDTRISLWLSAPEALELLQVRPQTLYASVSRGRIRARPDASDQRRSVYHRGDVQRLAERKRGRRSSEAVARKAIRWGEPVLDSGVSTVAGGRLWYRGQDACAMAEKATLEEVAGCLWEGATPSFGVAAEHGDGQAGPLASGLLALAARAADDPPSRGRSPTMLRIEAAGVIGTLASALLGERNRRPLPMHERLAKAWRRPRAADVLRRVLVLLADHELNASTFAARVTASTGASLSACLLTGLSTLTGPLHGGAAKAAQELGRLAEKVGAEDAVRDWLAQGRPLAGFGHPLYPEGDVRCAALLAHLDVPPLFDELRRVGERLVGEAPNIDFALAAMATVHRLPPGAPLIVFALARSVGWTAHALEQTATGRLIRPRARYAGAAIGAAG